eukprot:777386-Amphidinium_carterae.1
MQLIGQTYAPRQERQDVNKIVEKCCSHGDLCSSFLFVFSGGGTILVPVSEGNHLCHQDPPQKGNNASSV